MPPTKHGGTPIGTRWLLERLLLGLQCPSAPGNCLVSPRVRPRVNAGLEMAFPREIEGGDVLGDFEKLSVRVPRLPERSTEEEAERARRYAARLASEQALEAKERANREQVRLGWANLPRSEPPKTFANLEVRKGVSGLGSAAAVAQRWDQGLGRPGLVLNGPWGVGKSHVAEAVARELVAASRSVRWQSVVALLAELRGAYGRQEDADGFLAKVAHTPWLILDDLGRERVTEWVQDRVYWLIEERQRSRMRTLVTTNDTRASMEQRLGGAIADRVFDEGSGLVTVVTITGSSYRTGCR